MSSPSRHGPLSAVAPSSPSSAARDAASASADGGSPSTCAGSVRVREKALVASSRLLEKAVESSESRMRLALKRSFSSPCRPTPERRIDDSELCTIRCCAGSSEPSFSSASSALKTASD